MIPFSFPLAEMRREQDDLRRQQLLAELLVPRRVEPEPEADKPEEQQEEKP